MAVIISDNGNAAFDGNWSTVNAWYRVEAHNLIDAGSTLIASLTTAVKTIDVTFANAGNCQGVGLYLAAGFGYDRGMTVYLQETKSTCTISIASPGVVTSAGHGLADNSTVTITTTGALPTGLTAGAVYYVRNAAANTFELSLTSGGASINTSGTQSGTHTLWANRATKALTYTEIMAGTSAITFAYEIITPFDFDTPYAVDTTASKWRIAYWSVGGTSGNWSMHTSDNTNVNYFTWCDNQVSYSVNDTAIIKNKVTIESNVTLGGVTATGYTTNGICLVICRTDTTPDVDNVANLLWDSTPAATYTLTLKGIALCSSRGGFRIGTTTNRIPAAQKATILHGTPTTGSRCGFDGYRVSSTTVYQRANFFFYGEVPTNQSTTLVGDLASGATSFVTADAMGWVNGDTVVVGKLDVADYGLTTPERTVTSVVGTTVNLSTSVGYARKSGAQIIRTNGHGVILTAAAGVNASWILGCPANWVMSGMRIDNSGGSTANPLIFLTVSGVQAGYACMEDSANTIAWTMEDSMLYGTSASQIFGQMTIPEKGLNVTRLNSSNSGVPFSTVTASAGASGPISITNCRWLVGRAGFMVFGNFHNGSTFGNNFIENTSGSITFGGNNWTVQNNAVWGSSITTGFIRFGTMTNTTAWSGNTWNKMVSVFNFSSTVGISDILTNEVFGNLVANTEDISFGTGGAYLDFEFASPTGNLTMTTTNLPTCIVGTKLRISDFNDTSYDDRVWTPFGYFVRCKTGLADTTVHTAGGSAIRFQPTSSTTALAYSFDVPTGSLINKDVTISCWVKINSATYYAGTHQKPTLRVNYDNGTVATAVALGNTDWQKLVVPFTPTTTFGKLTITVDGYTDATSTNAYFYLDDFGGGYLVNSTLDDWANALPVSPAYAFVISANEFWGASDQIDYGTNTMGNRVKVLKNPTALIGPLIV